MGSCSPAMDRISNLPCSIIDNILKFLPLRDAVRTSILSTDWKYKWVTIPHLIFDRNFEKSLNSKYDIESIIDRTLLFHEGAITKFSVTPDCLKFVHPTITSWLLFLLDHKIEDLALSSHHSVMPIHLFAFDHLKHLYIEHFTVKLPSAFRGFSSLARLVLDSVHIQLGDLLRWLSKCPMLEYLHLEDCHYGGVLEKLPDELIHLTVLKLAAIDFALRDHATSALSLIRNSPKLRSLEITCDDAGDDKVEQYLKAQRRTFVPLKCLEYVKIDGLFGWATEMEFLKILLRWATALKKLNIACDFCRFEGDESKFLREFPRFRRASIEAEIIVTWNVSCHCNDFDDTSSTGD